MRKTRAVFQTAQVKVALRRLRSNPDLGKHLGGKLKGCQSIRLEGSENRVVYRQVEMGGQRVIEILAIDRRRDNEVYNKAQHRT